MDDAVFTAVADEEAAKALAKTPGFLDPKLPKQVFSHSQYITYKICAMSYYFKYVLGITWKPNIYSVRGSAVHRGAELALKKKMEGKAVKLEEMLQLISEDFDVRALEVEDWQGTSPPKLKDLALRLYAIYHHLALPQLDPVAVEQFFAVKYGSVPMVGYIDVLAKMPAIALPSSLTEAADSPYKLVVRDLKTSEKSWSEQQISNNTQITLYCDVKGVPDAYIDQLLLTKVPTFKSAPTSRNAQQAKVLREDIEETVDLVKKGVFPKTRIDDWSCGPRCPYWDRCRGKKK